VSRRARAIGFACAAAICAGLAAGISGARPDESPGYGDLRDVVVATAALPGGRTLGRDAVAGSLSVRRIPERFLPPDALATPAQALGRRPAATIPAGGYLMASQFRTAASPSAGTAQSLPGDRRPVEIEVRGAAALATGARPRRVDVVVTSEPGPGSTRGRTFVAASAVDLLDLRPADDPAIPSPAGSPGDSWVATLALGRAQALRLIHAQSFARDLRLIGR
jgi:Flp pilus assembly protein CpaB